MDRKIDSSNSRRDLIENTIRSIAKFACQHTNNFEVQSREHARSQKMKLNKIANKNLMSYKKTRLDVWNI